MIDPKYRCLPILSTFSLEKYSVSHVFVTISVRDNEWESGKQGFTNNLGAPLPTYNFIKTLRLKFSKKGNKKYINNMAEEVSEHVPKKKQKAIFAAQKFAIQKNTGDSAANYSEINDQNKSETT